MFRIRKRFKYEGAHVLQTSWSEACQSIHGHSYVVEVVLEGEQLNDDGMLIDFGLLKQIIQPTIDAFDHALVVKTVLWDTVQVETARLFGATKVLVVEYNPTAEEMAFDFYNRWWKPIHVETNGVADLIAVRIHETATGWAEYREEK